MVSESYEPPVMKKIMFLFHLILINLKLNLNSCMCLVATVLVQIQTISTITKILLGSAGLEHKPGNFSYKESE